LGSLATAYGGDFVSENKKGKMTVEEAGRKGGETTSEEYGEEFYREIGEKGGKKGGPRVRELVEEGKEHEEE
jgi:general stress protein YciG